MQVCSCQTRSSVLKLAQRVLQVYSVCTRCGVSPTRHGEIIGPGLNQLAKRTSARYSEFHQPITQLAMNARWQRAAACVPRMCPVSRKS
ncbi:hypothetical protein QL285_009180 [Trifolium repens]|nr:hypothetical protein QL285_009180 [Trifolium repens]